MDYLPVRPLIKSSSADGAWIIAQKADQRRKFKAIICTLKADSRMQFQKENSKMKAPFSLKSKDRFTIQKILDSCRVIHPKEVAAINLTFCDLIPSKEDFFNFTSVYKIDLSGNNLTMDCLRTFPFLVELNLSSNHLTGINIRSKDFQNLKILDVSFNNLRSEDITMLGLLKNLKKLSLCGNELDDLPKEMGQPFVDESRQIVSRFNELEELNLEHNLLHSYEIFATLGVLKKLKILKLSHNKLEEIPLLKLSNCQNKTEDEAEELSENEEECYEEEIEFISQYSEDNYPFNSKNYRNSIIELRIPSPLSEVDEEQSHETRRDSSKTSEIVSSERTGADSEVSSKVKSSLFGGLKSPMEMQDIVNEVESFEVEEDIKDDSINTDQYQVDGDNGNKNKEEILDTFEKPVEVNDIVGNENKIEEFGSLNKEKTAIEAEIEGGGGEEKDVFENQVEKTDNEDKNGVVENEIEEACNVDKNDVVENQVEDGNGDKSNGIENEIEEGGNGDKNDGVENQVKEGGNGVENQVEEGGNGVENQVEEGGIGDKNNGVKHQAEEIGSGDRKDVGDESLMDDSAIKRKNDVNGSHTEVQNSVVDNEERMELFDNVQNNEKTNESNIQESAGIKELGISDSLLENNDEFHQPSIVKGVSFVDNRVTKGLERQYSMIEPAVGKAVDDSTIVLQEAIFEAKANEEQLEETSYLKANDMNIFDKPQNTFLKELSDIDTMRLMKNSFSSIVVNREYGRSSITDIIRIIALDATENRDQSPFPALEHLDVSYNRIKDERTLISTIAWMNVKRISVHENPLSLNKTQKHSFVKALLENTFKIKIDWLPPIPEGMDVYSKTKLMPTITDSLPKSTIRKSSVSNAQEIPKESFTIPKLKPISKIVGNDVDHDNNQKALVEFDNCEHILSEDNDENLEEFKSLIKHNKSLALRALQYSVEHPVTLLNRQVDLFLQQKSLKQHKKPPENKKVVKQKKTDFICEVLQDQNAHIVQSEIPLAKVLNPSYFENNRLRLRQSVTARNALNTMQSKYNQIRQETLSK